MSGVRNFVEALIEFVSVVWLPFAFVSVVFVLAMMVVFHISLEGDAVKIESVRADVRRVAASSSEDVIGQATAWNQQIAEMRRYNQMLGICVLIPNGWDAIEPIEIPE